MPAWIHDRAEHLLAKNPSMNKSTAFAIATQQSHKLGKTPKGYGTKAGKSEAKKKYDQPRKKYVKGANPGNLETPKLKKRKKADITKFSKMAEHLKLAIGASPMKPPPLPKPEGPTPQQRLKQSQDVGSVDSFNQKTQGMKMQEYKPMSMMKQNAIKLGFQKSQYSGPLSMGRFSYRNPLGMPSNPQGMKVAGPPPPGEEEEMNGFKKKEGSLSRAARNAIEAMGEWEVKQGAPTTPQGSPNTGMQVGAAKAVAPAGPSIAQLSKPVGYGKPLPGAAKGPL